MAGQPPRQLATLLGSSAKSVEERLGRLFACTGYRSRIELASALLDHGSLGHPRIGDHDPGPGAR